MLVKSKNATLVGEPFNVNALAQVAALAALDDLEHVHRAVRLNAQQMDRLETEFRKRDLATLPSQANFILVDFARDAVAVFDKLLREGVIVRPMGGYGFPTRARITVGTEEQNDRLLQAIDAVVV